MGTFSARYLEATEAERAHADLIRRYLAGEPLPAVPAQHGARSHLAVTVAMGVAAIALVGFSGLVLWPGELALRTRTLAVFPRPSLPVAAREVPAAEAKLRQALASPAQTPLEFEAPAAGPQALPTPYQACMATPSMDGAMEDCSVWLSPATTQRR
jgi:hypothetical protein